LLFLSDFALLDPEGNTLKDRGGLFGDKYLLASNADKVLDSDLLAGGDGALGVLPFKKARKLLGKPIEQLI
jgi:hypothetical protein